MVLQAPQVRARLRLGGWGCWLAVWTLLGLVLRIGAVLGRQSRPAGGDAFYYHAAANLLVDGKGWINPVSYYLDHGKVVATAAYPPGFVLVLAVVSLVGLKSYLAHRIWAGVIGAAAVAVCGLAGREIAGRRAGLIVAFIVAIYPNIWMSDEPAMSETLTPLLVALVLLTAYRFWRRPGLAAAVWLGLSEGVATLCRDELSVLGLLVLVPVVLLAKPYAWRRRLLALGVAAGAALMLVAPWVSYNLVRFEDPVFISTGLGPTLASANCTALYSGPKEGYWSLPCAAAAVGPASKDESVTSSHQQSYALHVIRTHADRMIAVNAARLGRGFGAFHPIQQIQLDAFLEGRPYRWALTGLGMYYALLLLSGPGAWLLHRRRVPIFPLLAVGVTVALTMILSFGDTRYRTPFEVSLVIMASVTLDGAWTRFRPSLATQADLSGAGPR